MPTSPQTKKRKNKHHYDDETDQINYRVHEKISFSFRASLNWGRKPDESDPIVFQT